MSAPLTHISVHVSLIIWEALPPHNISALHLSLLPLLHFLSCLTSSSSAALGTLLLFLQVPPTASSIRSISLFFFFFLNDQPGLFLSFFSSEGFLNKWTPHNFPLFPHLCHFVLCGAFFSSARLLHLFATVPIWWGHHSTRVCFFFFSILTFFFLCECIVCGSRLVCTSALFLPLSRCVSVP